MPDMSKPGAHLRACLEEIEFKQEDHVREARKHEIMASAYGECAHRLKRAIEAEDEKAEKALEAACVAELN
jgi:hypothetical protein